MPEFTSSIARSRRRVASFSSTMRSMPAPSARAHDAAVARRIGRAACRARSPPRPSARGARAARASVRGGQQRRVAAHHQQRAREVAERRLGHHARRARCRAARPAPPTRGRPGRRTSARTRSRWWPITTTVRPTPSCIERVEHVRRAAAGPPSGAAPWRGRCSCACPCRRPAPAPRRPGVRVSVHRVAGLSIRSCRSAAPDRRAPRPPPARGRAPCCTGSSVSASTTAT